MTSFISKLKLSVIALLLTAVSVAYGSLDEECEDTCFSCSPCWGKTSISADFLYWKVHQGGFACGCLPDEIDNVINEKGKVLSQFRGNRKDPHFKWNAGFRIGTAYEFINQRWDIAAYWTHFHTHIHDQHQYNHFSWKLDYEVIDVLIGRKFCLESFIIRPFIGIRAAQIEQKVQSISRVTYTTFISSDNLMLPALTDFLLTKENDKEKFRGIGPLIGIEADWNLGCGFSLYACASISSLYGHFNLSFKGSNTFLNGTKTSDKNAHLHSCQLSTDALLGMRWQHYFCNNRELIFQLTLEQHRYFDHNHLSDYGDLCLDGVSFSGSVSF